MPDPLGLLHEIRKEFQVIKGAPFSFLVVCVVSFLICWGIFEGDLHLKSDTIQSYKERLDSINSAVKASPSESVQTVLYAKDPNMEKVRPTDTNQAALAYSPNGSIFGWDTNSQSWK
jgi:hypothetical protein